MRRYSKIINHMKNLRENIKTGMIIIVAFGLFILALFVFFIFTDDKETENNNGYKSEVDKSVKNSEYSGQTYVNKKYKFKIIFPKNWNMLTGDNPHILQKAESGKNSIYVSIFEFDKSLFKKYDNLEKPTIKDVFSIDDYKNFVVEGIKQTNQITGIKDLKFLDYFNTEINGIPAYGFKASYTQNKNGVMGEYIQVNYDIMFGNIKYGITGITPAQDFISVQENIISSINSFQLLGD